MWHIDNHGNTGIISEGDVQWMTAGSGIMHQEFFEQNFNKQGGEFSMVQLWINLPAKDKLTVPKYQANTKDMIPKVKVDNHQVQVIAGEFQGTPGIASTFTLINILLVDLKNIEPSKSSNFELGFGRTG